VGGQDSRGSLIRPYTVTRGRTEPRIDIAIEAVLVTTERGRREARFAGRDKRIVADLCDHQVQSLAEIAAHTNIPIGVAKVIVADMVSDQLLTLHTTERGSYAEQMNLLERLLDGLRAL
jgi:hypothetical protein